MWPAVTGETPYDTKGAEDPRPGIARFRQGYPGMPISFLKTKLSKRWRHPCRDVVANPQVCPTFRKFLLRNTLAGQSITVARRAASEASN